MRYKVNHYMNIRMREGGKEQWEELRRNKKAKEYCIESDIELYEYNCRRNLGSKRAAQLLAEILGNRTLRIASLGVGKAHLEWHLKQINPFVYICCTDYTEKALEELQKVFTACNEFMSFDMLKDDWGRLGHYDYLLLNRVNSEFNFVQWQGLFRKMAKNKIRRIIFIPSRFGSIQDFCLNLRNSFHAGENVKTAWCYTEYDFLRMWKKYYRVVKKISFDDRAIYFLEIKVK